MFGDPRLPERFWKKVRWSDTGGCWLWIAAHNGKYGKAGRNGKVVSVHRWAYEALVAPIPVGLVIDHLCRVTTCVNPDHLEPVTTRENLLRGDTVTAMYAARTHCQEGHPFSPENTYISHGWRACRACRRAINTRSRKKNPRTRTPLRDNGNRKAMA